LDEDEYQLIGLQLVDILESNLLNLNYSPELFINCFVSSRRVFADGAEFKMRGTRSQIPENLGHVPEFGARLQIHDRER
jgi:hypothetical protein